MPVIADAPVPAVHQKSNPSINGAEKVVGAGVAILQFGAQRPLLPFKKRKNLELKDTDTRFNRNPVRSHGSPRAMFASSGSLCLSSFLNEQLARTNRRPARSRSTAEN